MGLKTNKKVALSGLGLFFAGFCVVIGIAFAPVTFGASVALAVAGGVTIAGGVVAIGGAVAEDIRRNKVREEQVQEEQKQRLLDQQAELRSVRQQATTVTRSTAATARRRVGAATDPRLLAQKPAAHEDKAVRE